MRREDAAAVAGYHQEGIPTGVLADLGPGVLTKLYRALAEDEGSFVFVGVDESDRVLGFVAGVEDVGAMYRRVLRRRALSFALSSLRALFSLRLARRVLNTLRYPAKVEGEFPEPELLSIVVDPITRGSGLAADLLAALLSEFHRRGIAIIKVMVRADFERANAYYRKHGFVLAGRIERHGNDANIYTIETRP